MYTVKCVVICFQISIFEPLKTVIQQFVTMKLKLWFAFKLVSLNHWKQFGIELANKFLVVICFQISIFEPLKTVSAKFYTIAGVLWFAFKLVSLNHWKQYHRQRSSNHNVVICFQISIFEPLKTVEEVTNITLKELWFAFKLVSLNHWKQFEQVLVLVRWCCDLLSN